MLPRTAVLFLAFAASGCEPKSPPRDRADMLVLEVGGTASSLRQSLVAAGVHVGAARRLRSPVEQAPAPVEVEPPPRGPSKEEQPDVAPPSARNEATPPEEPAFVVVPLARGQTLVHLAREHLGNGNRYPELMSFNGWDEAAARRLRDGQLVKIPRLPQPAKSR